MSKQLRCSDIFLSLISYNSLTFKTEKKGQSFISQFSKKNINPMKKRAIFVGVKFTFIKYKTNYCFKLVLFRGKQNAK